MDHHHFSRNRLILVLLFSSLLMVFVLAWQAVKVSRSHYETVNLVLQDYATLVNDEFSRRAMVKVGYQTYFNLVKKLPQLLDENGNLSQPELEELFDSSDAEISQLFFAFTKDKREFFDRTNRSVSKKLRPLLLSMENQFLRESSDAQSPFTVAHLNNDETDTVIYARTKSVTIGFVVNRDRLTQLLEEIFSQGNLLPTSLAKSQLTNEFIDLSFVAPNDQIIFQSANKYYNSIQVRKVLSDEYSGIFRGYKLLSAIDSDIAGSLVIGGLPKANLPILIILILLVVGLLATAIRQLQREHALSSLRSRFVAEVSHELRTPLTQISMFTETLLLKRVRDDEEKQRALAIISRETKRLIHLVENILSFSQPARRKSKSYHPLDLKLTIDSVVMEFEPLVDVSQSTIICELESLSACIDPDAFRQVLLNLLDNAVKYGRAKQTIQIFLTRHKDNARIAIVDQGSGISPIQSEKIWTNYYRIIKQEESHVAGTGIGLSVVKKLVQLMNGACWVEPNEPNGSRFVIEIPLCLKTHEQLSPHTSEAET